jgi:steroid delta-isomerase
MATADQIRQVFERYPELVTKGDYEGIVELYHEEATIEDPIGSDLRRGRDAIREFYKRSAGTVLMKLTGPVRVAGHEAAAPLRVLIGPEAQRQALDVIDVMTFDDDARITSMRAFWSMDALRPATADDD